MQEKLDGRWCEKTIAGAGFVGELMPDSRFIPFDCVSVNGQDISGEPLVFRLSEMRRLAGDMETCPQGSTAEFIHAVIGRGGEGVVIKPANSAFGYGWTKAKVSETFDCWIEEIAANRESIRLSVDGTDRGWCPVTGGRLIDGWDYRPRISALHVGDVVEIACHSIHRSGLFREARFIRARNDKAILF